MPELKVGISLPTSGDPGDPDLVLAARHVEELGLDSVAVPDLTLGDGMPALESVTALAAVAGATSRVRLAFGVLVLPLRPVAWVAAQIATLQHLSGGRVVLGVGSGGFPGAPFWTAVDLPAGDRGRRTDAALEVLPRLIAGEPTSLDGRGPVTLAPPAPVPPIVIGGNSDIAIRRAAGYGDGWLPSLIPPEALPSRVRRLRELAAEFGRPAPGITVGGHAIVGAGAAARDARDALVRSAVEVHGMSPDEAAKIPITGRDPAELADRFAAYAAAGVEGFTLSPDGADWLRQCELIAAARALVA